jgi:hypothetical protein
LVEGLAGFAEEFHEAGADDLQFGPVGAGTT